jgi:hypothetical protein
MDVLVDREMKGWVNKITDGWNVKCHDGWINDKINGIIN